MSAASATAASKDKECATCSASFKTADQLQQHMTDTGHLGDDWSCEQCDKVFKSAQGLQQHVTDTGHAQLACACGKVFESEFSLLQHAHSTGHASKAKSGAKSKPAAAGAGAGAGASKPAAEVLSCKECGREFSSPTAMTQHLQSTGHDNSAWSCSECDKKFEDGARLQQHSAGTGHHNALFACVDCRVVSRNSQSSACPRWGLMSGHVFESLDLCSFKFS